MGLFCLMSKNIEIIVHYPENESEIIELRRRMGSAYSQFIKNYILTLTISDKEKNKLYTSIVGHLLEHKGDKA